MQKYNSATQESCWQTKLPRLTLTARITSRARPSPCLVYVPDVDATTKQATAAGATVERPIADQFYGDRTAGLKDPFGHVWYLATHVRDVSKEEMEQHMHASA